MTGDLLVFDRKAVRAHRIRAGRMLGAPAAEGADLLYREVAARLVDRLDDIRREYPTVLDLGCHGGALARALQAQRGIGRVVHADLAAPFAAAARPVLDALALAADEELLPFRADAFDLVVSNLALHWVNDLPGALIQICRALRADGLMLAALLGGETLTELRQALMAAELEVEGGAGPRVSPFADVRDAGALLQRAGFALPVVDRDRIVVTYGDAFALMRDLRTMGETNAVMRRRRGFTRRATLFRAAALYAERFGAGDGRIRATFDVIFLTGWKPDPSQPRALQPGSARHRLADALGVGETDLGDSGSGRNGR